MHTESIAAKNDDLAAAVGGVKESSVETHTDSIATKNDALAPVVEGVKESFVETNNNNKLEVEGIEGVNGYVESSDSDNDVLSSLVKASADLNSNMVEVEHKESATSNAVAKRERKSPKRFID
jgi:hypothetical protein